MINEITVSKLKANCYNIIDSVNQKGLEYVISSKGIKKAKIIPIAQTGEKETFFGLFKNKAELSLSDKVKSHEDHYNFKTNHNESE